MQLPREFVIQREVQAIQHFGQNRLERIPPGEIVFAERGSRYTRMIEAVLQGKRYLIFERDLTERAEPLRKPVDQDSVEPLVVDQRELPEAAEQLKIKQVRAMVRREDVPPTHTEWYRLGSVEVIQTLERLLPINGERFMVVWEEREVERKEESAKTSKAR